MMTHVCVYIYDFLFECIARVGIANLASRYVCIRMLKCVCMSDRKEACAYVFMISFPQTSFVMLRILTALTELLELDLGVVCIVC